jgi:predicted enzyme related to lactoylglutathione lyase
MAAPIIHVEWKSAHFARTSEFYARVFQWKTEQNGSGSYMKLDGADGPSAGWVRADLVQAPGPIAFLAVDDLGATLDEIESAGGRVLVRSMPFAGGGEIALFADPDDNILGLWRRKPGSADGAATKPAGEGATAAKPAGEGAAATKPAGKPATKAPKPPGKPKKAK